MNEDVPNQINGDSWNMYTVLKLKKNRSLYGTLVNGHQLTPPLPWSHQKDLAQCGVYSTKPPECEYAFSSPLMSLTHKERERALLMNQIRVLKEESKAVQQKAFQEKENVLSNIVDLMDVKLLCIICREYLITATALNCSHVFCNLCIKQWMRVKKVCPYCRSPITSHSHIPVLDNCIEKLIEQFDDEIKRQRRDVLQQRKIEQDEFDCSESGFFNALTSFMMAGGRVVGLGEIFRRAAAHTQSIVYTGVAVLSRAVVPTNVIARFGTATIGAASAARTETRTRIQTCYASAVYRRLVTLAQETVSTGAKELSKSAVFRRAAALRRVVALRRMKALKRSFLMRAATFAKDVQRLEIMRKVAELKRSAVHALSRHLTVRKAMMLTRAEIKKGTRFKKGHLVKSLKCMKTTVIRNAVQAKRMSTQLRALTTSRLAALKRAVMYTKTSASIATKAKTARFPSTGEFICNFDEVNNTYVFVSSWLKYFAF